MHEASNRRDVTIVQALLEGGADVNAGDNQGIYPLHTAGRAAQAGNVEAVEVLFQYRAGVDVRDSSHSTPLHKASQSGHAPVTEALLKWGADVNARDYQDTFPLHNAARYGKLRVVQVLLRYGEEVHARDNNDSTPSHHAS